MMFDDEKEVVVESETPATEEDSATEASESDGETAEGGEDKAE